MKHTNKEPKGDETSISKTIGKITAVVLAVTALIGAIVHFRDSIPWLTPVSKLELAPPTINIGVGERDRLTASVRDSSGNNLAKTIAWMSADPSVATVDKDGIIEGKGRGQTTISAAVGSVQSSTIVSVRNVSVAYLEVFPPAKTLQINDHLKFDATPYDSENNPLPDRKILWSSEDEVIASVDQTTGETIAWSAGTVKIDVASEAKQNAATIKVNPKSAASSAAEPAPPPAPPPPDSTTTTPGGGGARGGGRRGAGAIGARASVPAVVLPQQPLPHVAMSTTSAVATATINITNGMKTKSCPAAVRILVGETMIEIHSDPQEAASIPAGTASYNLHGTVSCPGETVAVVNGKGSITVANGKQYRCVWKQVRPKVFEIELKD